MKIFCQLFLPVSARYQHHTIFLAPMATVTTRKYQGELPADNIHHAGDTFLITLLLIDTVRMRDDLTAMKGNDERDIDKPAF
jgi:hypothetical protein